MEKSLRGLHEKYSDELRESIQEMKGLTDEEGMFYVGWVKSRVLVLFEIVDDLGEIMSEYE